MVAIKLVNTKNISREEWLEWRRKGIGGSDAAAIVGLHPYSSQLAVWADKLGLLPEKEDSEAMRQGRDLEDYVAQRWEEATGKRCRRTNFMYRHQDYPWMTANVDREVVGENAGLECKTTSVYNKSDFEGGEVPLYYYCQCMHYMAVMGYARMYLAVLVLNKGFYTFEIERDEQEITNLIAAERAFWENYVQAGDRPAADGSDSAQDVVDALYPHEAEKEQALLYGQEAMLAEYKAIGEQEKALKQRKDAIKQEIELIMKKSAVGVAEGYKVSWVSQSRPKTDYKALEKDYPDAYANCVSNSTSRTFRLSEKKSEKKGA